MELPAPVAGDPRAEGGRDRAAVEERLFSEEYLLERPLLRAIRQTIAPVLLIDEIDRADEEFEAYLLEVLSDFQITIPELGTITATTRPMVILTANGTRDLSDALRRRCLYAHVDYPDPATELAILNARAAPDEATAWGADRGVRAVRAERGSGEEARRGRDAGFRRRPCRASGWRPDRPTPAILQAALATLAQDASDRANITTEVAQRLAGKARMRGGVTRFAARDPGPMARVRASWAPARQRLPPGRGRDRNGAGGAGGLSRPTKPVRARSRPSACGCAEDWARFDAVFDSFWRNGGRVRAKAVPSAGPPAATTAGAEGQSGGAGKADAPDSDRGGEAEAAAKGG
jgi:hypothetical protein